MKMTTIINYSLVLLALFFVPVSCAIGQTASTPRLVATEGSGDEEFNVILLASDLDHPWSIAILPDSRILITERPGRLFLYEPGQAGALREVAGLPEISPNGQGGLLDVVLHPDFQSNGWVYLTYSSSYERGFGTTLARGRLRGAALTDVRELFRMSGPDRSGQHFGSRLAFGTDGKLYMTIGERGSRDRAQDTGDHAGSVLRLNDDGSVPADNPFVGTPGALPEIYSYGHRNAQGLALGPTGEMWLHEHGPRGGDEINIVAPGANYGWPVISYGAEYGSGRPVGEGTSMPGMMQPLTYWVPSIAPSGMTFYDGEAFPSWNGDLFVGALAGEHLRRVDLEDGRIVGQEVLLQGVVGRIRDVRTGPDGLLYFITDEDRGGLYRLEP